LIKEVLNGAMFLRARGHPLKG